MPRSSEAPFLGVGMGLRPKHYPRILATLDREQLGIAGGGVLRRGFALLASADLAAVAPEVWAGLRFEAVPFLQVLSCAWPVHRVRERFERENTETVWDRAPSLVAEPTHVRVWRHDDRVRYRAMPRLEHEALAAATAGESFAAICERMAQAVGEANAASQAAALLASWLSEGLFALVL